MSKKPDDPRDSGIGQHSFANPDEDDDRRNSPIEEVTESDEPDESDESDESVDPADPILDPIPILNPVDPLVAMAADPLSGAQLSLVPMFTGESDDDVEN